MIRHFRIVAVAVIVALSGVFILLGGCVHYRQYRPDGQEGAIVLFDYYSLAIESEENEQSGYLDNRFPIKMTPTFLHPIKDTAGVNIDTIPMLAIDSVCFYLDCTKERLCSKTYRYSDFLREQARVDTAFHYLPDFDDVYVRNDSLLLYEIIPFSPIQIADSCKSVSVMFTARKLDRTTGVELDRESISIDLGRNKWFHTSVGS